MMYEKDRILKFSCTPKAAEILTKDWERMVAGTVLKIVNGNPTTQRLGAGNAFSDPNQAAEQVLYAECHGSMVNRPS